MSRSRISLLLAVLVAGCTPFRKINVFTVPQEMAIGEIFSSEVETYYPILHDPRLEWYINHRGRMLADLSDRRDLPYRFGVVDSPELNAFAIPGGHIYVNLGMIEACQNENELVGLLSHEIGHVIAKHSMKQITQYSVVQIVGTIALNQYPNQWAALAANLFSAGGLLKLSREAESEADAIGVELMLRAGYDPNGMAGVFEYLLKRYDEEPGLLDKLFATHPPTRERIASVKADIAERTLPPTLLRTTNEYDEVYRHVIQTYYTEAGRKRWRDILADKEDEARRESDRLPWDTKSDEERKKAKEKQKERQAKEREKREREAEQRGEGVPAPAPTPEAVPTPEPMPGGGDEPAGSGPLAGGGLR